MSEPTHLSKHIASSFHERNIHTPPEIFYEVTQIAHLNIYLPYLAVNGRVRIQRHFESPISVPAPSPQNHQPWLQIHLNLLDKKPYSRSSYSSRTDVSMMEEFSTALRGPWNPEALHNSYAPTAARFTGLYPPST